MSAREWRCDVCGKVDHWGPGWLQYGTLDDVEFVVCSTACARERTGDVQVIR